MKKSTRKLIHILGTIFLLLGTIMSTITSVVTASTVSSVEVSRVVSSSRKASSEVTSSSTTTSAVASSSVESSRTINANSVKASSQAKTLVANSNVQASKMTTSHDAQAQELAASQSSATANSAATGNTTPSATPIGQTKISETPYGGRQGSQGFYKHFHTSNGDVCYCYNWQLLAPDKVGGVEYNQYKFYDGLEDVVGNQTKVDEVASALEAGYHKDATTGKYNVAPQFQKIADESYKDFESKTQGNDINPQNNGPYYETVPSNYTEAEFEEDVTQSVIWYLDGAPDTESTSGDTTTFQEGYLATHTALGKALLSYAKDHPLDQQTAFPKNVAVTKTSGGVVSDSNPLVMDPQTKLSQPFQLSNYNGGVNITGLPAGYEIVDSNGNIVNQVQSGQTYRVKYVGSGNPSSTTVNNTVNKITAKASYEALKDSNYFSAVMQNAAPGTNNKWQNMVNLETTENTFSFPIIWSSIASSSSTKSSAVSSVKSSSVVKSSSAKSSSIASNKKSSSSAKSSSIASSKKSSSSAKSSSIASSKKSSSSVKSSSVASSKKATATTSSETTKNSSSKATKTISSVASAKKTSSSVSTKAATSSSNNTTSAKKGVVAGVANHSSNSGKGTGHGQGKGEGHGMPQTGEAVATSLIAAGVVLLAAAGAITLRKRN